MKILHIINSLTGGGAEKLINDIAPLMNIDGNACDVLIQTEENEKYLTNLKIKGIKIFVIPYKNRFDIRIINYIKKLISKNKYNIIHTHLFPMFYFGAMISDFCKSKNIKLIYTEHNTDNKRRHKSFFRPIEKYIYAKYHKIISISSQTQESLLNWIQSESNSNFSVIENGIPLDVFKNSNPYEKRDLIPNIPEDNVLLCMIGSFTKQKNHFILIEAMKKLPSNYYLVLVGEGVLKSEIKEEVNKSSLSDRIVFLGFRYDIGNIVKTTDISIVPSLWEGFGLVAIESMACGNPVVVSDVAGLKDIVGDAGIVFKSDDSSDLTNKILSLANSKVYDLFCEKAKNHAEQYSIYKMVDKYLKIYEEIE